MSFNFDNPQDSEETPLVEYNLSLKKTEHIGNLLTSADRLYLHGNVIKAFESLTRICRRIRNRFSEKEFKYGKKLEFLFRKNRFQKDTGKRIAIYDFLYDKYDLFIERMLKKYGYDVKERQNEEYLV